MTSKGFLVAGPVAQANGRFGGTGAFGSEPQKPKYEVVNHASAVADYDFGVDRDSQASKFEKYTHVCSSSVAQARLEAGLSQA